MGKHKCRRKQELASGFMGQDFETSFTDQVAHYFVYKIPFSGSSDKRVRRPRDKTLYIYSTLLCLHYVYECILYCICISIFRSSRKIDEREEAVYSYNSAH